MSAVSVEGLAVAAPFPCEGDLAWLDRLLEREILRLRARYELSLDEWRGLYVSDAQVDALLRGRATEADQGPAERLTAEAARLRAARPRGTPLETLSVQLGLSPFEADVVLLAAAPDLALKYEALYAYLNNDVTRRRATVDLALRALHVAAPPDRSALRAGGRLFTLGVLEWVDPASERRSQLAREFAASPAAVQFLMGLAIEDARLPPGVCVLPAAGWIPGHERLPPSARSAIDAFASRHPAAPGLVVCAGDTASEPIAGIRAYAGRQGRPVLMLPLAALAAEPGPAADVRTRVRLLALLSRALIVLFDDLDAFPSDPSVLLSLRRCLRELAASGASLAWVVPRGAPWLTVVGDLPFSELTLPPATADERAETWHKAMSRLGAPLARTVANALAERFVMPCSHIAVAAQTAAWHTTGNSDDAADEAVWRAARSHSSHTLEHLAQRVEKPHRFEDLVLPDATLRQVREVAAAAAHRDRVYRRWGMAARTGRGTGLAVLFAGSSGTGKTMTAAVIARSLGLELYRIDLASVVSKYIGETEKNLERIFSAARRSNAILLFDEADALLGKRSEVKDAHDRYANIEVAYLLQSMEDHEGVVILATNLAKNLDQAFARRLHYVVEFPRPDGPLRERLWRGMFPTQAPLAPDVDFAFIAGQFELTGGEIQTVALEAAFLASADGDSIGMTHIVRALARQQANQGNAGGRSAFKHYHGLTRRE